MKTRWETESHIDNDVSDYLDIEEEFEEKMDEIEHFNDDENKKSEKKRLLESNFYKKSSDFLTYLKNNLKDYGIEDFLFRLISYRKFKDEFPKNTEKTFGRNNFQRKKIQVLKSQHVIKLCIFKSWNYSFSFKF